MWASTRCGEAQYYKHEQPRSLITSGGLGTMGFALPAAIGAKVACPGKEVWAIAGDGGFQMTSPELATIVQEKLDINIAIINNGYLGMIRQWQETFYEKNYECSPIFSPDFVKLAEAFGIRAAAVTKRFRGHENGGSGALPQRAFPHQFHGGAGRYGLPDDRAGSRAARDDPPPVEQSTDRNGVGRLERFPCSTHSSPTWKISLVCLPA